MPVNMMLDLYKFDNTKITVPEKSDIIPYVYRTDQSQTSLNHYDQIIQILKNNYEGQYAPVMDNVTIHGGAYMVFGFMQGNYGGFITFSYWDKAVAHIRCQEGTWSYRTFTLS